PAAKQAQLPRRIGGDRPASLARRGEWIVGQRICGGGEWIDRCSVAGRGKWVERGLVVLVAERVRGPCRRRGPLGSRDQSGPLRAPIRVLPIVATAVIERRIGARRNQAEGRLILDVDDPDGHRLLLSGRGRRA